MKISQDGLLFGNFTIKWYGILMMLGVLLAVLLARKREKALGLKEDTTLDLALLCVPLAIVGARLYYVAFSWDIYKDDLLKIFSLREGGMAIYGGVLAGALGGWIFSRVRKVRFWTLADLAAPSVALGQAIGRWGNFLNQEAYGYRVDNPALQWFPMSVYIERVGEWHLATFFYESVWCFLIVLVLLLAERRGKLHEPGDMFLWYLLLYGAERAVVEGLRTDSLMLGSLRISQMLALILVLFAAVTLAVRAKRRRLRT